MNILHVILPMLSACGVLTAQSKWEITAHEGQAILLHEFDSKEGVAPGIEGLVEILASRDRSIPFKHITFWTYFNNAPAVQGELLSEFKSRHPDILADAFKSSGNMHNPKVLPLHSKFSECLLKTPTLTKLNEVFLKHGYSVKRIEFEKFWIDKEKKATTPFHAVIWLILEPNVDEEAQH
jgi:hypothetical protein